MTTPASEGCTPPTGGDLNEWSEYRAQTASGDDPVEGLFDPFGTVIIGEPFAGKTTLALNIAAAMAIGAPSYLDRAVRGGEHRIAYIGTDPGALPRASERMDLLVTDSASRARIRLEQVPGRADDPSAWSRWWHRQQLYGVATVILDNLLGAAGETADVSTTPGARPILARLGDLVDEGAAVLAVGHTSKGSATYRSGRTVVGSVAFEAFFRRKIHVSRYKQPDAPDILGLTVTSNDAAREPGELFARREEPGWLALSEPPRRSRTSGLDASGAAALPRERRRRADNAAVLSAVNGLPEPERNSGAAVGRALHQAGLAKSADAGRKVWDRVRGQTPPHDLAILGIAA